MKTGPAVLLINPHIEDFSAYDHFCAPLGLYHLSAHLKDYCPTHYINALVREKSTRPTAPLVQEEIPAPAILDDIPRKYRRYGMSADDFLDALRSTPFVPDYILITSGMTYWYRGLAFSLKLIREIFPDTTVVLGGTYAGLLPEHASKRKGINHVISGQDLDGVLSKLSAIMGIDLPIQYRVPDYDLVTDRPYLPVMTTRGCVFDCDYCASPLLSRFTRFPVESIAKELLSQYQTRGVDTFAFYDDALLVQSEQHIDAFLRIIINSRAAVKFYTPNGLHIRFLNKQTAKLMYQAGFQEVRFSLESIDSQFMAEKGNKAAQEEFIQTVRYLKEAGFQTSQIRTYTLANVPDQDPHSIIPTMKWAWEQGAVPFLAFYSPIPGTPDFQRATEITELAEPLFQNNTVYLYRSGFDTALYQRLRSIQNNYLKQAKLREDPGLS